MPKRRLSDAATLNRTTPDQPIKSAFPIVGIGASAGGLEACRQLLAALPADTGMAFVFVQHLAPSHVSALAEILSRVTPLPVMEVRDEQVVEPNHVYVIPPGQTMVIAQGRLQLRPREGGGVPHPVDLFLRSLAEDRGHQAIAVILSGTGSDGTFGVDAVKFEGGITFAQDASAQHEGMPHSAVASGSVDFVLPPDAIAREIARIGRHPHTAPESGAQPRPDRHDLSAVVQALHRGTGVDFADYKYNTLYRRVTRRMVLQKVKSLRDYNQVLEQNPAEVDALYHDILIGVTSFFRNPQAFDLLKAKVFPRLLEGRTRREPVRIWSLGCSTGQEAYSLAMAFVEAAGPDAVPLQVFATDLVERGISTARAGVYPRDIAQDVSPERLRRFFVEVDAGYQVSKAIRDVCVFSRHNVLADPPFSGIDLISCRNLLIYLEPVLQQQVMPLLHYALKPTGFLWLGGSETIGSYRTLFEVDDVQHKLYTKKPGPHGAIFRLQHHGTPHSGAVPLEVRAGSAPTDLLKESDRLLLMRFAPPSVLVNGDLEILHYRGDTTPYLAPSPGTPSLSLLKMLRDGLMVGVRATILEAARQRAPVRDEGLQVRSAEGDRAVAVEAIPLGGGAGSGGGFLLLFEDRTPADAAGQPPVARMTRRATGPDDEREGARLAHELAATRDYLQAVIEQQEAANEELQSANEEVQSANEELQSINEELETSKEEIQSSNEELATVNDELNNRNLELNRVNDDLVNLIASTQMAIVIAGADLCIRRFTPAAEKLLGLRASDIGRRLPDVALPVAGIGDLEALLTEVIDTVTIKELDVRDPQGRWYSLRLRPYRTLDNRIDGVVALLIDVDVITRAHEATALLSAIVTTSEDAIFSRSLDGVVTTWNAGAERLVGYTSAEVLGRPFTELGAVHDSDDERGVLQRVRNGEVVAHYETVLRHKSGRVIDVSMSVSPLSDVAGRVVGVSTVASDVTQRKRAEQQVRAIEQQFRGTIEQVTDYAIFSTDRLGRPTSWNQGVERILGFPEAEFIGQAIEERIFTAAAIGAGVPQQERTAADRDGSVASERWMQRRNGEPFFANDVTTALRDDDGKVGGFTKVMREMTDQVRREELLRDSEERFRTLADHISQFLWTADAAGRIYWYNQRWYDYTGTTFEQVAGAGWTQLLHPDHAARVVARLQRSWDTGEPWEDTFPLRGRDGEYRWFLSRAVPIRDATGTVLRWFGTNTDITDQRHLEDELRQNAADMLEADHRKDEFLAMLAHELRGPLAPIRNALHVLRLAGADDGVAQAETIRSVSSMMERQTAQMVRLVDDLLDVNRVSRGKVDLKLVPVELVSVVRHAVQASQGLIDRAGLTLIVDAPSDAIEVAGDAVRLMQVLGNLLNNAVKFARSGGTVTLTVAREDAEAVVSVRDDGLGIAPENLTRIFDLFMQVDTTLERTRSGLGLGLTLARTLVELHGGTIAARSAGLGAGAEFVMRLPLLGERPTVASVPPEGSPAEAPRRVLVVDDNVDSAESLAMVLSFGGHEVRMAHDGLDAVELAATFLPDLILLDIGLPRLNGYEAAGRIRALPTGRQMFIVALTGWGQVADRQRSADAGFNAHLVKPLDQAELAKLMNKLPPPTPAF
ncbi:MAG: PAS domain S-box protein [Acidobacteriota bacterium]